MVRFGFVGEDSVRFLRAGVVALTCVGPEDTGVDEVPAKGVSAEGRPCDKPGSVLLLE